MKSSELLTALADEVCSLRTELEQICTQWQNGSSGDLEPTNQYLAAIERLSEAAGFVGLSGVQRVVEIVTRNLLTIADLHGEAAEPMRGYFLDWLAPLELHLRSPEDEEIIGLLVDQLTLVLVPEPLNESEAQSLREDLRASGRIGAELEDQESAPTPLHEEDARLDISSDVDGALIAAFHDDAPPLSAQLTDSVAAWLRTPSDVQQLLAAKRAAHTLKGSANILGIRGIALLAHRLEDVLELCEDSADAPSARRARALMAAADCLAQMVAAVCGEDTPPGNTLDIAAALDAARIDAPEPEAPDAAEAVPTFVPVAPPVPITNAAPVQAINAAPPPQPVATTRVSGELLDKLVRMVGEMSIKLGELEQEVRLATDGAAQRGGQDALIQKRLFELEHSVDIRGLAALHRIGAGTKPDTGFDSLEMDQYNEIQGITRALLEEVTDSRDMGNAMRNRVTSLGVMVHDQRRLMREMQHLVAQTRMAPLDSILPRLQRNVRQTADATGKQVQLLVTGADILVDTEVLAGLVDPLLHILRNAVDHGIESPEERASRGKNPLGTITFEATRRGQLIVVSCADDGRGLDLQAIRHKAVQRGLLDAEATPDPADIARLTLLPGFSTREVTTEISGRGIGLDVVATRLRALNGTLDLHSEPGQGMRIDMQFQASMIATHALFVQAGAQRYAIASHTVQRALPAELVELEPGSEGLMARVGTELVRCFDLRELVGAERAGPEKGSDLVVVHTESGDIALLVDAVLAATELVTRRPGRHLRHLSGVTALGLTGEGHVVPLIDVAELVRTPAERALRAAVNQEHALSRHRVLVVDDSLSVRRSLATLLEDNGYDVVQARDGMDAVRCLDAALPDVVLTDMEMPNLNGLELTAHIRSRPNAEALPVIMITSRSMDKHRRQAIAAGVTLYLTKPYTENELLKQIASVLGEPDQQQIAAG